MNVRLDRDEVGFATVVGTGRYEWARRHHAKQNAGAVASLERDVAAAAAELAAAKAFGFYWNVSSGRRKLGDVCGGVNGSFPVEVRYTDVFDGRLIVRPDDDLTRPYVLVTGGNVTGEFELVGWVRGTELKREWLTDFGNGRPPVYAVPRSVLRPL